MCLREFRNTDRYEVEVLGKESMGPALRPWCHIELEIGVTKGYISELRDQRAFVEKYRSDVYRVP